MLNTSLWQHNSKILKTLLSIGAWFCVYTCDVTPRAMLAGAQAVSKYKCKNPVSALRMEKRGLWYHGIQDYN